METSNQSETQNAIDLLKAKPFIAKLRNKTILIKYGGNAMIEDKLKASVASDVALLYMLGIYPVVVHGGGPAIKQLLESVGKESEFIDGQRRTDFETMGYVEMALSGKVNSEIVKLLNANGVRAVGISGKDGNMIRASKRIHQSTINGELKEVDLGQVGSIDHIDTRLIHTLLDSGYIPVIAPIASGDDQTDYNINADVFAGYLAAALKAHTFMVLTDVDGIMTDINKPESLISRMNVSEAQLHMGEVIQGGMIPKVEACLSAIQKGVKKAHLINGMRPHNILSALLSDAPNGTIISQKSN